MNKLNAKALALAIGITWALGLLLLGGLGSFGWGTAAIQTIGSVYLGYCPTLTGSIIGAAWGLVDGVIAGLLIAVLYNVLAK